METIIYIVKDNERVFVYRNENDARKYYDKRLEYYNSHVNPSRDDRWSYKRILGWTNPREVGARFKRSLGNEREWFNLSVAKQEIL